MQEQRSISVQNLQNKPCSLIGKEISHPTIHKGTEHRRIFQTNGKDHLIGHYDTHGNCSIPVLIISFLNDGNIHQNQGVIILHLNTGALLLIQRRSQMIYIDPIGFSDLHQLRSSGINQRDPASFLCFIDLMYVVVNRSENFNHVTDLLSLSAASCEQLKVLPRPPLTALFFVFFFQLPTSRIRSAFHSITLPFISLF